MAKDLNVMKLGNCAKDAKSCRSKFKTLRIGFFDCVKGNKKSGNRRTIIENMDQLSLLFATRLRSTSLDHGYDSSSAEKPKE